MSLTEEITNALRSHVSSGMPIRLLLLPSMKLIERRAIFTHLLPKMSTITEEYIADKIATTKWENVQFVSTKEERRKLVLNDAIKARAEYAILSHTWLVNEPEVVYSQWTARPPTFDEQGPGYAKLKNFADVAHREHGMTLAWLDTLCINKDSTSELDESIRSMYRWYLNSALCIIILAETEKLEDVPKDRWFTRGWTLQELLAPKRLKFYAKNWTQLLEGDNDKNYEEKQKGDDSATTPPSNLAVFAPLIEEATGISLNELRTFDPKATRRNIPTRMVWASKRVTSREEDTAYCLMGIFGVSFSIAYGEGRERAFFRLLEAIITSYRDILAILDWSGKPIGEDVHATALLPAGPECYKYHPGEKRLESTDWADLQNYVPFTFTPREPMALTHLGLQIDLYCVPATVASINEHEGTYTVKMQLGAKFREEPVELTIYPHTVKRFDTEDDDGEGWCNEFMFGIWTFERDMHGNVYIPGSYQPCRAFLVESKDRALPVEMPRIWTKVNTPDVIRISPDSDYEGDWEKEKITVKTFIL